MPVSNECSTKTNFRDAISEFVDLLHDRFSSAHSIRDHHAQDEFFHLPCASDAVAFPKSIEDISEMVKICAKHEIPVVPFGTGTALEGGVNAILGGLSIDMCNMNKITAVCAEYMDCSVQTGVTRRELNEQLRDTGLFFPIGPWANASIAGVAATRESGTNAVRYDTMRAAVEIMKLVKGALDPKNIMNPGKVL